jgi:hypothetical protein
MAESARVFQKPTDWDELYPGRFLKAGEFKGKKVTLTIAAVELDELEGDKGKKVKGVLSFEKTDKQLALNKTNGICLKEMFGRKVQDWVGHKVTLYAGQWNGDECIRVWGSPELAEDRTITVQLPRKRPIEMVMHKVERPTAVPGGGGEA